MIHNTRRYSKMDELRIIKYLDGEMSGEELRDFEKEIRMNPPLAEELKKFRQVQDLAKKLLSDQDQQERDADTEGKEQAPGPESERQDTGRLERDQDTGPTETKLDPGPESEKQDTGRLERDWDPEQEKDLDPAVQKEILEAVEAFKTDPASFGDVPQEYREHVKQASETYGRSQGKAGSMRMIRRIWFSAAAVVLLAVVITILLVRPFERIPAGEVYSQYFRTFHKTEDIIELARTDNDFLFATEVYEAGDFERAVVLFEMLADSSEIRAWSLFYAGSSYMSLNQVENAIGLFMTVLEEGDEEVQSPARWQLALCHIKSGNPEEAREHLEILRDDPVFGRDARRILRILR